MATAILNRSQKRWRGLVSLLIAVSLAMISCGSSGDVAGGGIGGTGVYAGGISGFGSVFVNGVEFETLGTEITVDNNIVTENELKVGMKVNLAASNYNASTIIFEPDVKGPVTSIDINNNTLVVLGQSVTTDNSTVFEEITGLADINAGDNLLVSGFFSSNGEIQATLIELLSPSLLVFEVKGTVSNHNPGNKTFIIGALTVDYSNALNPPDIFDSDTVEVEGGLQAGTLVADELELDDTTATPGQNMEVEDLITVVISQSDFYVNGFRVQTTAETEFEHGTSNDIALNERVEVEGEVNGSGILIADSVEFKSFQESDVKLEGYVEAVSTANSTLTIFGLTVEVGPGTLFKDESVLEERYFDLSDIQAGDFVEIGGFVNNTGDIVAVKVERDDDQGPGNSELEGAVDSDNPLTSLVILSVDVDVSGATFEDSDDNSISAAVFFGLINPGDTVEVKGSYAADVFTATKAEIEN